MLVIVMHSGVAFTPKFNSRDMAERVIEKIQMIDDDSFVRIEHIQGHFNLKPCDIKESYIM